MALMQTINLPSGVAVPDAYHRVENVVITGKSSMRVLLRSYASAEEQFSAHHDVYVFPYDLGGDNPIRQAYMMLKDSPEFSGAADA